MAIAGYPLDGIAFPLPADPPGTPASRSVPYSGTLLGTAGMVVSIQLHTAPGEGIPVGTIASRGAGGKEGWHGSRGRARPQDTRP